MLKTFFKILILLFIISYSCYFLQVDMYYKIVESLLKNKEINTLLVTLIAGLFGFIAAIIPFAIHLLSQNNDFTNKLKRKDNLNMLIRPLFGRLIYFLIYMIILFFVLLVFSWLKDIFSFFENKEVFQEYFNNKKGFMYFIFSIYISCIYCFFKYLCMLVRDLKSLVNLFFKSL